MFLRGGQYERLTNAGIEGLKTSTSEPAADPQFGSARVVLLTLECLMYKVDAISKSNWRHLSMKTIKRNLVIFLSILVFTVAGYGQGLVNFLNSPTTLVSLLMPGDVVPVSIQWPPGSYYFGLLTGPAGTTNLSQFSFSGAYGTNQAVIGRFSGGSGIAVSGWAPEALVRFLWQAGRLTSDTISTRIG